MSRSTVKIAPAAPATNVRRHRSHGHSLPVRLLWHALCISLLPGCLWVRGGWKIKTNSPPEEFFVSPREQVIVDTQQAVWVQFKDTDEDQLIFTWLVDSNPARSEDVYTWPDSTDNGTVWNSRLTVKPEAVRDGSVITCTVTDGEPPPVRLDWTVVVP